MRNKEVSYKGSNFKFHFCYPLRNHWRAFLSQKNLMYTWISIEGLIKVLEEITSEHNYLKNGKHKVAAKGP